jgi:hypothetical protein
MTRSIFFWIMLFLASTGCVSDKSALAPPRTPLLPIAEPPPIIAEHVTAANAHEKSQALWDELDREAQKELIAPTSKSPEKRP